MTYNQKNQSAETDSEMTEMMELMNKGIKAAVINMLYMFRQVEEMVNIGERN